MTGSTPTSATSLPLPHWLQPWLGPLAGWNLFVIGFLDSSVLSFPFVVDFLLVEFSLHAPARMPFYVFMATAGSVAGCFWLYLLGRKGAASVQRHGGGRSQRIQRWVQRYRFLSVAVPAILPPPLPFKPFVLTAGAFEIPLSTFLTALFVGRGLRYALEGILALRYGPAAVRYFAENRLEFTLGIVLTVLLTYLAGRWLFARQPGH